MLDQVYLHGRVQSATLKLIVDREREINNFVKEEYWNILATLSDGKQEFLSKFYGKGKKQELHNKEEVDKVLDDIKNKDFVVKELKLRY